MEKVPPSEKLRKEIDEILSGKGSKEEDVLGALIERSLKMVFQRILEQEVRDYLGREYYERGTGVRKGHRNGYEPKRLKTAEGEVVLDAPQLRGTEESYRSEFLKRIEALSPQLKRLVVEMYARGLSTRDIEEALKDAETGRILVSKDGVSELTAELWEEYERFCERDLSGYDVVYLFADGVFESV
jgi:putative transposase